LPIAYLGKALILKIRVCAMLHRMGFHSALPFIASLVLCCQEQEATITQFRENFRVAAARLIARLDEQDSKIQKVSGRA